MDEDFLQNLREQSALISSKLSEMNTKVSGVLSEISGLSESIERLSREHSSSRAQESSAGTQSTQPQTASTGSVTTETPRQMVGTVTEAIRANFGPEFAKIVKEVLAPGVQAGPGERESMAARINDIRSGLGRLQRNPQNEEFFVRAEQFIDTLGGQGGISDAISKLEAVRNEIDQLNLREKTTGLSEQETERLQELNLSFEGVDELIAALRSLVTTVSSSTEAQGKNISGLISSVVGALGVQQFLMMRMVQQPYQYRTQPTLGAMGNTGLMGEALSGAYGAQEQVLQQYRQFAVTGVGGIGGLIGYGVGGGIGAAVGGGLGLLAGIAFKDPMADLLATGMEKDAFDIELSRRILDPQRYTQDFFMPTLQARMAFGLGGNVPGQDLAASQLAAMASPGARAMGYDSVVTGQVLGQYLSTLAPGLAPSTEEDARNLIDVTAQLESFGMSKDQVFSVMSGISRAGSEDYESSLGRLLLATSDDGEITNYTANVLVPALMQVVESRSIQNIAKSSEEVQKETAGLFSFFKNSDTNLGKMLAANPEAMNQVFGMLNQVGETALQDPALMLLLNRMGVSFQDVVTGDPRALMMPLQSFANVARYTPEGEIDLNSAQSISSIVGFLTMSGVGVNTGSFNLAAQMMEALNRGDFTEAEMLSEELYGETPESVLQQLVERLDTIAGTEGGATIQDIVNQSNDFYTLMGSHLEEMGALQDIMRGVLSSSEAIAELVKKAALTMVDEMIKIVGEENVDENILSSYLSLSTGGQINAENFNLGRAVDAIMRRPGFYQGHRLVSESAGVSYENFRSGMANLVFRQLPEDSDEILRILSPTIGGRFSQREVASGQSLSFAIGGYTGAGGRMDPVGVVHGGEYVISDNRVMGNRSTLERIQSGENFDENSSNSITTTNSGETIRVMLEFSNTNPEQIINAARLSAKQMLAEERLL